MKRFLKIINSFFCITLVTIIRTENDWIKINISHQQKKFYKIGVLFTWLKSQSYSSVLIVDFAVVLIHRDPANQHILK